MARQEQMAFKIRFDSEAQWEIVKISFSKVTNSIEAMG